MIIIEVYVDDIIFGSDDDRLSQQFAKDMQKEFEVSLLGAEIFLGSLDLSTKQWDIYLSIQVHQGNVEIFWNGRLQTCKYTNDYRV